jgi:hypothetical protein
MKRKLAVGYPWSSPFVFTSFADHLPNLQHPEGYEVRFFRGQGWCPARRHAHICEQAMAWGADLICIIGTDQIHPEDMLPRLVSRIERDGCEVITALVPTRGYVDWQDMKPFQPLAWRFKRTNGNAPMRQFRGLALDPDAIEIIKPEDGDLQRVNFIGSGVLMFQRDHLLALDLPWFSEMVDHKTQQRLSNMDCRFVWRLQSEAHAKVWVDTTIKVKHLHVFNIDDTYQNRFDDWMQPNMGDAAICRYQPMTTAPADPAAAA